MSYVKLLDVRFRYPFDQPQQLALKSMRAQATLPSTTSIAAVAAMLQVFNMRRDCYWDEKAHTFTTDPTSLWNPTPNAPDGIVKSWDIKITPGSDSKVFLNITSDDADFETSGDPSNDVVILDVDDQNLPAVIAVLSSSFCIWRGKQLWNTEIDVPSTR